MKELTIVVEIITGSKAGSNVILPRITRVIKDDHFGDAKTISSKTCTCSGN